MKRTVNKIAALFIAFCLFGLSVSAADKYPKPTSRFFVNDFADVVDSGAEDEMYSRAADLYKQTTAQVAVVTVNSLNGEEPADYALGLGRQWGVGDKKKNNGVVILLATTERQIYIAVGYGLEGALPDSKTGRIIDYYGYDYLKADDFSNGLLEISKAVINEIYIEYNVTPKEDYTPIDEISGETEEGYTKKVAVSWVLLIAVVVLYIMIFGRRGRGFWWFGGPHGGGFGGHGGSGFSGGGFSGGGGGFSGGGGGFSGGGGSFGGGGAGRGF